MKTIAVVTTIDNVDQARAIARTLVERRLAACAQISNIESFYMWEGAVQNDEEFRVLVKTTDERYADVETAIRELHTYDLPAVHAFDLLHVFEPYAEWVAENSSGEQS